MMHTFVINLERRKDRLELFLKDYNNLEFFKNTKITRINAIDGETQKFENDKKENAEHCCALSWIETLKTIIKNNEIEDTDIAFIFEDDCKFYKEFDEEIGEVIENFKKIIEKDEGYEFLYIGGRWNIGNKRFEPLKKYISKLENYKYRKVMLWEEENSLFKRKTGEIISYDTQRCNQCIILTKRQAKKIVSMIEESNIFRQIYPIDNMFELFEGYEHFPHLCYTEFNDFDSDIRKNVLV